MSWYPTHTDDEVLGATVGATGAAASGVGDAGPEGAAGPTGVTGPTGQTGSEVDNFYMSDIGPSGNLTVTDNTVRILGPQLRSQGVRGDLGTERNEYSSSDFFCRLTGLYRVSFIVRARQSTTTDRAGLMRITWGRYNTTSPRDDVLLEQYGGCLSDGGGDVSICGLWVGTLTNGQRYGLWNDTAGTGTLRRPTGQNSVMLVEWIR